MKYNELPHVLEYNKKQAAKHKEETIASLRVELAAQSARIAELEKALESIEYQGRVFGKDNITADLCGKLAREALLKKG